MSMRPRLTSPRPSCHAFPFSDSVNRVYRPLYIIPPAIGHYVDTFLTKDEKPSDQGADNEICNMKIYINASKTSLSC